MRSTQYIGLTEEAIEFLENGKYKRFANYPMTTGIAMEHIQGVVYNNPEGVIIREVVDKEPWCGGPMIFTCLRINDSSEKICRWDPKIISKMSG